MTKRRIGANWALLLVSGVVSMILAAPLVAQVDSPDPDALVREMSSFLGSQKAFHFHAEVTFDDVPVPDIKVQYSGHMEAFLRRPDGLKVDYRDELTERRFWIDEEAATLARRGRKGT